MTVPRTTNSPINEKLSNVTTKDEDHHSSDWKFWALYEILNN